jgi:non-heme chloroperoxidase
VTAQLGLRLQPVLFQFREDPLTDWRDARMRLIVAGLGWSLVFFAATICAAQNSTSSDKQEVWRDPSPHAVQFITVDNDVRLEVLDWGGTGRPVVLLAGLRNTSHVFDDFAPKLTAKYHVYGITRRGFGASSAPVPGSENYSADRLGDDVLAVLDALKLDRPVLVGHSIAGEELSSVATRHPERIAGLIYLDAGYYYANYDRSVGRANFTIDLVTLQRALDKLQKGPPDKPLVDELLNEDMPALESDLQEARKSPPSKALLAAQPPAATNADKQNFATFRAWWVRTRGFAMPESELRQLFESTPEGHVGKPRGNPAIAEAVNAGVQKYTNIRVPVLGVFASPADPGPFVDSATRAAVEATALETTAMEVNAFEKDLPSARVVRLAHANHYVFLSNEADVLREMSAFLGSLSPKVSSAD